MDSGATPDVPRRFSPSLRARRGALTAVLLLVLTSPSWAQSGITLDQAVSTALSGSCSGLQGAQGVAGGKYGAGISGPGFTFSLCPTAGSGVVSGTSGGSVTAGARPSLFEEERRVLQRLDEKREKQGGAPGASADTAIGGGLSLFVSAEFERFSKDITKFEPGYDSSNVGGTLGVDYAFTPSIVAGIALTYTGVHGDFDRSRGGFDTDVYGALLYAGFFPVKNFFVDVIAGYTHHEYLIEREVNFAGTTGNGFVQRNGIALGQASGDQFKAGVAAGYDFVIKNFTVGPRAGVNYRHLTIHPFAEKGRDATACLNATCVSVGTTGLELAYERQEETSLTTQAGVFASLALSTGFGVIVPQVTAEYVHEFEDDQRTIRFRFVDDFARTPLKFNNDPPDRNYFNVGAGVVAVLRNGIAPFLNYRTLVGYSDQSSHVVTAGVRIPF